MKKTNVLFKILKTIIEIMDMRGYVCPPSYSLIKDTDHIHIQNNNKEDWENITRVEEFLEILLL